MTRLRFDNPNTAETFEEHIEFSWDVPYTLRLKKFSKDDHVPLHYAKTLEILICERLKGVIHINGKTYTLDGGNHAFFVAPYVLHSSEITQCDGTEYVIKTDFDQMSSFLNIKNMLQYDGQEIDWINPKCEYYDELYDITQKLIQYDSDFTKCISLFASLIDVFRRNANEQYSMENRCLIEENSKLRRLIEWTENNYQNRITIDDAASVLGYSKYYFCTYFKKQTNLTYLDYLNYVRISKACRFLRLNYSVKEAAHMAGFESLSYFNRLFKNMMEVTPKQYADMSKTS